MYNSLDCKQGNLCTIQILDDQPTNRELQVWLQRRVPNVQNGNKEKLNGVTRQDKKILSFKV